MPPLLAPTAPAVGECRVLEHTNASGEELKYLPSVLSNDAGCCACKEARPSCSVFVYCDRREGCDNGFATVYAYGLCVLKSQPLAAGGPLEVYARGSIVPWVSGYIL